MSGGREQKVILDTAVKVARGYIKYQVTKMRDPCMTAVTTREAEHDTACCTAHCLWLIQRGTPTGIPDMAKPPPKLS